MRSKLNRMDEKLDRILRNQQTIYNSEQRILNMSAETDQAIADMTAQLDATKAGVDSAVVLLNSIPALLTASGIPAAQVATFTASLKSNLQPLLDAVVADGPQTAPPGPVVTAAARRG